MTGALVAEIGGRKGNVAHLDGPRIAEHAVLEGRIHGDVQRSVHVEIDLGAQQRSKCFHRRAVARELSEEDLRRRTGQRNRRRHMVGEVASAGTTRETSPLFSASAASMLRPVIW